MKAIYFDEPKKSTSELIEFKGYDNSNEASYKALRDTLNIGSTEYPYISTRLKREVVETLTNPQAIFASKKLVKVADGKFYYDGVEKGTVTTGSKSIVDIQGNVVIFPDKKAYNYNTNTFSSFTSPDIDYACVIDNRVWGVKDNHIYASMLGDYSQWSTFNNLDNDSYAVDVAGNEPFIGLINYQNHVTLFQKNRLFELYGNKPSNYSVRESSVIGSTNSKSIIEVDSILFSLHTSGVKAYVGGDPRDVAKNINMEFVSAISGSDKLNLYMCIFDGTTYSLFVYNTRHKIWYKEDNSNIIDFAFYNGTLYALYSDGKLMKFNSSASELFNWSFETQDFFFFNDNKKKFVNSISIDVKELTGVANIYIKYDGNSYTNIGMLQASETLSIVKIPIARCEKFSLKVAGTGTIVLKGIYQNIIWG